MIGRPVTVDTPPGSPILVARGGDVVHVGNFISGDADDSAYGRVVVEANVGDMKFDATSGYIWRVISPSTAAKIVANLEVEMLHLRQALNARALINSIAKVKP